MRTHYRIDDFQETYFVIDDLDELLELAHIDFAPLYERVADAARATSPATCCRPTASITRGTGRYHAAKRRAERSGMTTAAESQRVLITGAAGNLGPRGGRAPSPRAAPGWCWSIARPTRCGRPSATQTRSACSCRPTCSTPTQAAAAVAAAVERFGRIDVLCNLAGGFRMGEAVHETTRRDLGLPVRPQRAHAAAHGARRRAAHARARRRQDRQRRRVRRAEGRGADGRLHRVEERA